MIISKIIKTAWTERTPLLLALLLFVASLGLVSSHAIIICMILICLNQRKYINDVINRKKSSYQIIGIIIVLSFLNEVAHVLINTDVAILELIPYSIFIFITMVASQVVDERVLKWLMVFTIVDIGVAVAQRFLGINSFYAGTAMDVADTDILYDLKVNGLNVNSSALGYKSFLLIILYDCYPSTRFVKKKWIIYALAVLGVLLSFNRTSMIGIIVYVMILSLKHKWLYVLYGAFLLLLLNSETFDIISRQLLRGSSDVVSGMNGREDIFPWFWNFFLEHPLFGNGSFKLYLDEGNGLTSHAHNAYLQTITTNGIIIFFLYILLIVKSISKRNFKYVFPILVCGLFQAFILWGTSYNDFVFWGVLLGNIHTNNSVKDLKSIHA